MKQSLFSSLDFTKVIAVLFVSLTIIGCPLPGDQPSEIVKNTADYPYVVNDSTYYSYIKVYNKSDYDLELDIVYKDSTGVTVATTTTTLNSHESNEFHQSNFIGSVHLEALGEKYALQSHLETKRYDNQGAALAQKATQLTRFGIHWFYHLGVNDFGQGGLRSTVVTANLWYPGSIYARIVAPGGLCSDQIVVEIPPSNLHIFKPLDEFSSVYPNGVDNLPFYIQGNTSASDPGSGLTNFTGAHFSEDSTGSIGLFNYKYQMEWSGNTDKSAYKYFVDVQDNDIRQDRIILKRNGPASITEVLKQYTLHFYDTSGAEVAGSPVVIDIEEDFGELGSYVTLSPRQLLGNAFQGSVWLDPPVDGSGRKIRLLQAGIIKDDTGNWRDITDSSPARNFSTWGGSIAYVSNEDPNWHYRLTLFYPGPIHEVDPDADEFPIYFCPPGTTPPEAGSGVVVLKFYEYTGTYMGAIACYMHANETRYFDIDSIAETYLNGTFKGSVEFLPHVAQQLELWHTNGNAHGSTGNWAANQY